MKLEQYGLIFIRFVHFMELLLFVAFQVEDKIIMTVQVQTTDVHHKLVIVDIAETSIPAATKTRLNHKCKLIVLLQMFCK